MKKIFYALLTIALAGGCATSREDSGNSDELRYLEIWVRDHFGVTESTGLGIYILDDQPGTGEAYDGENFVYLDYTSKDMEGNISSTTDEKLSKQLGKYNSSSYYGPTVWYMGSSSVSVGVEEILNGMRPGGTRTALVPSWLMGTKRYSKTSKYFKTVTGSSPMIYTFKMKDFFDDVTQWELDSLGNMFKGLDTLSYGFYYIRTKNPSSSEAFPSDTTVFINYKGTLLNGKVFDTNVADTAKFHGLYSSSKNYGPIAIQWGENVTDIQMGSLSSSGSYSYSTPIEGFQRTLWQMHPGEAGIGIFYSGLGYSYSGSGSTIPPYSPLVFHIEMTEGE